MSEEVILKWSTHPVKRNLKISILVALFLLLIFVCVYFTTYSYFLTLLSVVIMLGSLSPFFLPTYYQLSSDKIQVKFLFNNKVKEWREYRSYYVDKNGVLLSPFVSPSRLENFRGLYLRFNQNKDDVVNLVKEKIKRD
jgi:hypothetical protein